MPSITTVTATYERKVQLDDFEPITHRVELRAEVDDDENAGAVHEQLADQAEEMVEREIASRVAQKELTGDDEDD